MEYGVFVCNFNRLADIFWPCRGSWKSPTQERQKQKNSPEKGWRLPASAPLNPHINGNQGAPLSCTPLSSNNAFRLRHLGFPDLVRRGRPDRADADFVPSPIGCRAPPAAWW